MTSTKALDSFKKVSIVDYVVVEIKYCLNVVFKSGWSKFVIDDDDSLNDAI